MADLPELPGAPHAEAAKQWGVVTELFIKPLSTLAQAKAEAYAIKTVTKARVEATEFELRAQRRAVEQQIKWQRNLDAIAVKALAILPDNVAAGDRDPDWFDNFTDYAKHSSDEEARDRWARLLAGEVIQPGKFSVRLLQLISSLRKSEAEKFADFCNHVWIDLSGRRFFCI
jgi:hypothetical protein